MLVLSRRIGEEIVINNNIRVTVVAVKGDRVRLGFTAPMDVTVDRAEIHERRREFDIPVAVPADHADAEVQFGVMHSIPNHATDTHKH